MAEPSPISLCVHDPLVELRLARVCSAASQLASVQCVEALAELRHLPPGSVGLLVVTERDLSELGELLVSAQAPESLALLTSDGHEAALELMRQAPTLRHLITWPDFLTSPRQWDLACAAQAHVLPQREWSWQDLLPRAAAHVSWQLYSSFDRDSIIEALGALVRQTMREERLAEMAAEVAYEMAMNAMYDAPVDPSGRPKYNHDRHQDIALEDHEVPQLQLACDGTTLVLQIDDPFGRLRRQDVLEGIIRGLAARHATDSAEVLNTRHGGAGLGIFRMFQLTTSLYFSVVKHQHTRVIAAFDISLRMRDRRAYPTSLHLLFR